ncbi:hypothetical protein [Curtobacterium sp. MEB011]|uniref:hypothetical protein n=1 Tax=Curtobacterium sp. MEB011 TaxID=3040285 RepID=UPI00254A1C1E|nr:hypothetical protein [Curtobacterium sp. MEB011]
MVVPRGGTQSGRRLTINPGSITISADRSWRRGLHVLIEGRVIRQNGTPGQQRRGVAFVDDVRWPGDVPMTELPAEYQSYLEAARRAEAAR